MRKFALLIIFTSILFQSCTHDNEEELYGEECKKENLSYSEDISSIISNHCILCHSDANYTSLGGGIPLEAYENVKNFAESGALLGTVKHLSGYTPMPKGGAKLDDCQLEQIEIWIEEGFLNN